MPHTAQRQPGLEVPVCLTPKLKMDPAAPCYRNSDRIQLCPLKILSAQIRLDSPTVKRKATQSRGQDFKDPLQG